MWSDHLDFLQVVKHNWKLLVIGCPLFCLSTKLKWLKVVLKEWHKQVLGKMGKKISEFEDKIVALEYSLLEAPSQVVEQQLLKVRDEHSMRSTREEIH